MIGDNQSLLINVISIIPDEVDCYIQAPDLEDDIILGLMSDTKYDYYKCIKLGGWRKDKFLSQIRNNQIEEYFQSFKISLNDKLLFEGYDGVEFGIISNSIILPEWFIKKYVETRICNISKEW